MRGHRKRSPQPAALPQRLLAGLIDSAAATLIVVLAVAVGLVGLVVYRRARDVEEESEPWAEEFHLPRSVHVALLLVGGSVEVAYRNWRGPGFRVVGLRRVDARTGGPVMAGSAVIGLVFDQAVQGATRPLTRSVTKEQKDRMRALRPKLKEIERAHRDDPPEVAQQKIMNLYEEAEIKPFAGCGRRLVTGLVLRLALSAVTRDGRTVRDRLTGTTVVVDP